MTEEYVEELIQKYADGIATEKEARQLMHWYSAASITDVQWPSAQPGESQEVYHRMLQRLGQDISSNKAPVVHFRWLKVAAILLVIVGLGFVLLQFVKPFSNNYVTVVTPHGKIQLVILPDSSKLWLNASTEIRYKKSFLKNRNIELKGEAFFDVAHDATHPFVIDAGGLQTTVVGTSFNIKAYESENKTTVSVISGKVKIGDSEKNPSVLSSAMQYQFNRGEQKSTIVTIDTNSVVAWKKGRLHFEGESFANIASSLEKWYGVKIEFNNTAMRNCRYYMSFDNRDSLEKILSVMAELVNINYSTDIASNTITLFGDGCQ